MNKAERYAKDYLQQEIREIEISERNNELPQLSLYEKAVIYKYSEDGYEGVNELLRTYKGSKSTNFGIAVDYCLSKLNSFSGLVYRCVELTPFELKQYAHAYQTGKPIKEFAFISTSKSRLIAMGYNKNTLFVILSKTGKEIEKIAKFGIHNPSNEKEVLFKAGRSFNVVGITKEGKQTLITMREI